MIRRYRALRHNVTETSERVVAVCARIIVALIGLIAGHVYVAASARGEAPWRV